jgi:hypothetical protein
MQERHSFEQIEGNEQLQNADQIKKEIMGSLYLYKSFFQILDLFSSKFNESVMEMIAGERQSDGGEDPPLAAPPDSSDS